MNLQDFFSNAWRWKCNIPEEESIRVPTLESLKETEWDATFEKLMRNRLVMGAFRYGLLGKKGDIQYNRISSMVKRLEQYKRTGNKELLVDVANLCLLEFVEGKHPLAHFHAIDENDHVTII